MATGIVSVAAADQAQDAFSLALLALCAVAYLALVALHAARIAGFARRVRVELSEPRTAFDFLTFVAASGVVGARAAVEGWAGDATDLWFVAVAAWALLAAAVGRAVLTGPRGGAWRLRANCFLAVVSTQSLAVLGAIVAVRRAWPALALAALAWWVAGLALYAVVGPALGRRLLLLRIAPADFAPELWIVMGALAISVLAGARVLAALGELGPPGWVHHAVADATLAAWALGTAYIPSLVVSELRAARSVPGALRYRIGRWTTVFPLGMYASASHDLGGALSQGWLIDVSHVAFWVAVAAWALTAAGLVRAGVARLRRVTAEA